MVRDSYKRIALLPLKIERYELESHQRDVSSGFRRYTTTIHLYGGGFEGVGEDVSYDAEDQLALQEAGPVQDLSGCFTFDTFSSLLDGVDLFPQPPQREASREYRRWAFESAALDLALRQAGVSLAEVLGRELLPLHFVVSRRVGEPPTAAPLLEVLGRYPTTRFKIDPTESWDQALIDEIAGLNIVAIADLKGQYKKVAEGVAQAANPELYGLVAAAFPNAWIEDPQLTPETEAVLKPDWQRITWDAPFHTLKFLQDLNPQPLAMNVKPSRFGRISELFAVYDYCEARGIQMYGGGQFELGPGRGQIQYLASLFHAEGPNDVAPQGYNEPQVPAELMASPLEPAPTTVGFRWE